MPDLFYHDHGQKLIISSGKDAHTRNKRQGAQLSNNTIKGNASQQTRQGAGLGKKENAELKRDRPL